MDTQVPSVETPVVLPGRAAAATAAAEPQPPPEPRPKTVLLIVHAPGGRCWDATVAGRPVRDGCGSVEFSLEVEGFVLVHFERGQYGEGQITALIEAAGRIVQTVGPTTDQYPSFNIGCRVPGSE